VGPLPAGNDVKVDITLREQLVFPLQERPVLRGYDEFADVPEGRRIRVYALEEIAAEKILAVCDRARNEPRDLYDLWYLTCQHSVELEPVTAAVREKLAFRGKPYEGLTAALLAKESRLRALWSGRLAFQMSRLDPFDEVFRAVRRALRGASLP
jgi:uncharacterized protein